MANVSQNLEQLEHEVEDRMRLLDALPPVVVPQVAVDAAKIRVRAEAARLERRLRLAAPRRWALGFTAAAAMIAALVVPGTIVVDADSDLDAWLAAMDASSSKLVAVVEPASLPHEWRGEDDAAAELEAWSESFDSSLDHFGAL
jgi:hypothetical protein